MSDDVEWRPAVGWEGLYEVTACGRVRRVGGGEKVWTANGRGYPVVGLWRQNRGVVCYVHALVAETYLGPRPPGGTVNHIDGDKTNNTVANLEYLTLSQNSQHGHRAGLMRVRGSQNGGAKLTEEQVRDIRRRAHAGERTSALAREFGVKQPIISQIKGGQRWAHLV